MLVQALSQLKIVRVYYSLRIWTTGAGTAAADFKPLLTSRSLKEVGLKLLDLKLPNYSMYFRWKTKD